MQKKRNMANIGIIERPTNILRVIIGTLIYTIEEETPKHIPDFLSEYGESEDKLKKFENIERNQKHTTHLTTNYNNREYKKKVPKIPKIQDEILKEREVDIEFSEIMNDNAPDTAIEYRAYETFRSIKGVKPYLNVSLFKKIEKNTAIKRAKILKTVVYLFFQTVTDAISFYLENKEDHCMSFENEFSYEEEKQNIKHFEEMVNIEVNKSIFPQKRIIKQKKIRIVENINKGSFSVENNTNYMKNELFNEFNDRIVFFATIFKKITVDELHAIEEAFALGDFSIILSNAKELCVGGQSNIFMQDVLKSVSEKQLLQLICELEHDIGPISATKYGAYVVQSILNLIETPELETLVLHYFKKYAPLLITHPLGNYSIQTLKKFDPSFFVFIFIDNLESVTQTNIGMKVFKKYLDLFAAYAYELEEAIKQCEEPHRSNIRKIFYKQDASETNVL